MTTDRLIVGNIGTIRSFLCVVVLALLPVATFSDEQAIVEELNHLLQSYVDEAGRFDAVAGLDIAVWKRSHQTDKLTPVYRASFGKVRNQAELDQLLGLPGRKISSSLRSISQTVQAQGLDVAAPLLSLDDEPQIAYRIASNSKGFIGLAAVMLAARYPDFSLDHKVSKYLDLSKLGKAHGWHQPTTQSAYIAEFPSASEFAQQMTIRHLLNHTSGLSREALKDELYGYGSNRSATPACPPSGQGGQHNCDASLADNQWRNWVPHIIEHMMPACGYAHYPEASPRLSCRPGEYYHYSNAAYSILGLTLDRFLKKDVDPALSIESWIEEHIFDAVGMADTVYTWADYSSSQKLRSAHGCYGGKDYTSCNFARALTDYADRGIKTPPGGIWSTSDDLARYLLSFNELPGAGKITEQEQSVPYDAVSEEDKIHMPAGIFSYSKGWYMSQDFSCTDGQQSTFMQGAWGTVPGFTSYMMTNPQPTADQDQYAIVALRSYNHAGRLNLGNQVRRFLWRLLHPQMPVSELRCPVVVPDAHATGDSPI